MGFYQKLSINLNVFVVPKDRGGGGGYVSRIIHILRITFFGWSSLRAPTYFLNFPILLLGVQFGRALLLKIIYLDDFCVIGSSSEEAIKDQLIVLRLAMVRLLY